MFRIAVYRSHSGSIVADKTFWSQTTYDRRRIAMNILNRHMQLVLALLFLTFVAILGDASTDGSNSRERARNKG